MCELAHTELCVARYILFIESILFLIRKQPSSAPRAALLLFAISITAPAFAHVHWHRVNDFSPGLTVGLYHFDEHGVGVGQTLKPAPGLPLNRGLLIGAPSGDGLASIHDVPGSIFEPHALHIRSAQIMDSTETVGDLEGDLTIEFWFMWDVDLEYQRVQIGLRSGAKIEIARSTVNPASDVFGVAFTHGDFVSAPGFVNWDEVGEEEAGLGDWRHVAVTIHSTGIHFEAGLGHDVYDPGSLARFWVNGHAVGEHPHTVDIAGMQMHDASRIRIRSLEGPIRIDEVTIWRKDWSENGTVPEPFADGRGEGIPQTVENWSLFDPAD